MFGMMSDFTTRNNKLGKKRKGLKIIKKNKISQGKRKIQRKNKSLSENYLGVKINGSRMKMMTMMMTQKQIKMMMFQKKKKVSKVIKLSKSINSSP